MRIALAGLAMIGFVACSSSSGDTSSSTGAQATTGGIGTSGATGGATSGGTTGATTGAGPLVDPRDNQTYPTVVIGTQTWLGANMNYITDGGASYCYNSQSSNCAADGRLYTYAAAQTACPPGWHLASDAEWKTLETTLGMAANQLDINGEDTARGTDQGTLLEDAADGGFGAKFSGYATGPDFYDLGTDGYFWTSTPDGSQIWRRHVYYKAPYLYRFENPPATFAISVRCLMDSN